MVIMVSSSCGSTSENCKRVERQSMIKKNTAITMALCGALAFGGTGILTGCGKDSSTTDTTVENTNTSTRVPEAETVVEEEPDVIRGVDENDEYAHGIHHAVLTVEGYAPVTIELNADAAPITVSNFAKLVNNGYYNGLTFYRFQDGFCMQGGTLGNNAAGNDPELDSILGEFAGNNQPNPLADDFQEGTVAMARTNDPDSASSTFFITLASNDTVSASLNGQYAAFGTISPEDMVTINQIVADHSAAGDDMMGIVTDEAGQAVIQSITILD